MRPRLPDRRFDLGHHGGRLDELQQRAAGETEQVAVGNGGAVGIAQRLTDGLTDRHAGHPGRVRGAGQG